MAFKTYETDKTRPLNELDLLGLAHDRILSYMDDEDGDLTSLNSAQWFVEIVAQRLQLSGAEPATGQDPWAEE